MIKSFSEKETEHFFSRIPSRKLPTNIQRVAFRKLLMLHAAHDLSDLLVPPGNRLEVLRGDRKGQYSIRINQQWRICFSWTGSDAHNVEITNYH